MRCLNLGGVTLAVVLLMCFGQACNRNGGIQTNSNQGGNKEETFADAQSAATQSLAAFRQLINKDNFKDLGFDSVEEAGSATLGEPLPVVFVRLDQLRQYQQGSDAGSLLGQSNQMNFPVMVKDQVRSSVVVENVNGRWKTSSLGNGALAKQIAAVRKAPTPSAGPAAPTVLVHTGALGLYFLGQKVDNKWMLTPLTAHPELELRAGASVPAEEVFGRLVPFAKKLRDDAPM